ncbi:ABC transporter permease [Lewinella sp. W8]|uniref:ABC transporter permease n=1 Tax=Lewinella sp. W8 TaxID=2528208 RepID=UPI001068390E|nr:ABC transporter permease [Lewinella sp. W8]MTB52896.1 ABC transporter permease subunit [Lewinella sp. W8]
MIGRRTQSKKLAIGWLLFLGILALVGDFLANDRPLIAIMEGETRFPVLHEYGEALGLVDPYAPVVRNWYRASPDWALWPPIPYTAGKSDLKNGGYISPFGKQNTGDRARHYLGTDDLGKDVLAGLIHGSRVAVLVGFGSTLLSLLLGIPLGSIAGFFGNGGLRAPRYYWWGWIVGGGCGMLYALVSLRPYFNYPGFLVSFFLCVAAIVVGGWALQALLKLIPRLRKPTALPADSMVLQGIELFVNIPGLVLLIALVAVINEPSISVVILVIGVLRWPSVARYLRAELLRIRHLPYIEGAKVSGIPAWRILFRHALPNAIGPLLIVASFGLGAAILLESFLSFLGVGIPADQVTWGSLLKQSRDHPAAWWMAVFPGLMLTLTVLSCNLLADPD